MVGTPVASPAIQRKAPSVLERNFEPQFTLDLITKDFRELLDPAGELGVPSPLATVVYSLYAQARTRGRGRLDYSIASVLAEELAGLTQ